MLPSVARRPPIAAPLDLFPVGGEGSSLDVEAHGVERHARHQTVANSTYDAGVFKRGSVGYAGLSVAARAPIFTAKRRRLSAISTGGRYSSRGFFGDGSSPRPDASPAGSSIQHDPRGRPVRILRSRSAGAPKPTQGAFSNLVRSPSAAASNHLVTRARPVRMRGTKKRHK